VTAILRKELADYFTSIRFFVFFALVLLASAAGLWAASQGIRNTYLPEGFIFLGLFTTPGIIPVFNSLPVLIALIVPLIGIALGFDAINSERTGGTLSRMLAQPVYRDSVINGKFLAGLVTMTIMIGAMILLISGFGLRMIGVPPTAEEIIRLFIYLFLTIVYGAFWMGLAILFSVLLRRIASSLLTSLGVWLFFSIFIFMVAPAIASAVVPVTTDSSQAELIRYTELQLMIMRFSPNFLFQEATRALINPVLVGSLGMVSASQQAYMIPNPLSLGQILLLIWPHLTSLVSLSAVCFAISYVLFMRQEIRPT